MKRLFFLIALLAAALPLRAQNSASGSITASSTNCTSVPLSCVWEQPLPFNAATTTINASGTFSATLLVEESNNGGLTWATAATITTAGTTTYAVNGFTDIRVRCSAFVSGTAVVSISTGLQTGLQGPPGPAGSGGGGVGAGAAPIMGYYLGPACPVANLGSCYFTPANTQQDNECTWTNLGTTVTCSDGPFKASDATKQAMGFQSCQSDLGAGNNNAISYTGSVTISTYVSATQVTLSATPINGTSAAGCFIWGTLDDTNTATFDTAIQASPTCPKAFLAAGYYYWQSPHFYTVPTACTVQGPGIGSFGTTSLPYGPELEGRGVGTTVVFLDTSFPNGDACTHKQTGSSTNGACFAIWLMGKWSDFSFSGGGQYSASGTNMANKNLMSTLVGTVQNFTCVNFHAYDGTMVGYDVDVLSRLYQYNNAGCGGIGIQTNGSGGMSEGYRITVENSPTAISLNSSNTFDCYACQFAGPAGPTSSNAIVLNLGGRYEMFGGVIGFSNTTASLNDIEIGYKATNSNAIAYFDGVNFVNFNDGGASNENSSMQCSVSGSKISVLNSSFTAQSSGRPYIDLAGCVLDDLGGNTALYTAGTGLSVNGAWYNESLSANLTAVTAAKLVLSSGWGASAANTALIGGDFPIQFTITNTGAGQGASPTITYTFPTPMAVAPFSCTAVDLSGTNPLLNPFTTSSLTKTGAVFTATGTPTVNDTEVMQITCVTP